MREDQPPAGATRTRHRAAPQFARRDVGFESLPAAEGRWAPGTLSGPAVAGLLAQVMDSEYGGPELTAGRLRVDLFRMVRTGRVDVSTRVVRAGRRIKVVEGELMQGGSAVVRGSVAFYRRSQNPDGRVWRDERTPVPPPPVADSRARLQGASGHGDYTEVPHRGATWQNADRKRVWATGWQVLDGETTSPFARAAMVSDCTNLVTGMGTNGVECINGDLALALSREPIGDEIGLEADQYSIDDGVYFGAASMFDRAGRFGVCSVTGLANQQHAIDAPDAPISDD